MVGLTDFSLEGRTALVTGASGDLGGAMTLALAEAGAVVGLAGGSDRARLNRMASQVETVGRLGGTFLADLSQMGEIERLAQEAQMALDQVDILVNAAGVIQRRPILEVTAEEWERQLALNARATFFLSQQLAKGMVSRGHGKIINVASMLSFQGGVLASPYSASKGAVASITRALANELAPRGVNVNAIAPGYFETQLTRPLRDDAERNRAILDRIPAGRWGRPEELSGAVVFLASRASDYCHGHILCVDGGWLGR